MLKDAIRTLAASKEKMSMMMGGQLQLAGVSAAEHKALQDALKNQDEKKGNYTLAVWG
ncbi:competence pheromone ComX [Paenibacillus lupini]|jgi:hypothetical protein|uniref:competence pheromone ComX n=1 Tax=Paenibacillus TaxID=44249 RepID=UPI00141FB934|nr:competence pheromone ComX [Paenibacillus lupini]NIK26525.1 hypothetical protein [Paenibacillus lupini]